VAIAAVTVFIGCGFDLRYAPKKVAVTEYRTKRKQRKAEDFMRVIRSIIGLLLIICLLIVGGTIVLFKYAIVDYPRVESKVELTAQDVARAVELKEKYDPRNLRDRQIASLEISNRDLNILLGYLVERLRRSNPFLKHFSRIDAQVRVFEKMAEIVFSVKLPTNPFGGFLNIGINFEETAVKPALRRIDIGELTISGKWIQPVLYFGRKTIERYDLAMEWPPFFDLLKKVSFYPNRLTVVYEWRATVAKQLAIKGQQFLFSEQDTRLLSVYINQIVKTTRSIKTSKAPLTDLMVPVFQLAQQRSEANGAPRDENRSAILSLCLFVNRREMGSLISDFSKSLIPQSKFIDITLRERTDSPKHFLVSAAITVLMDSRLSDMAGLFKELDDTISGSGFSFIDLLADRAGVRFAEVSTATVQLAKRAQQILSQPIRESDIMPAIGGLTEGLMQKTFKQRYRDLDSDAFQAEKKEIERRIAACSLYNPS
jgi:hypothetical protein